MVGRDCTAQRQRKSGSCNFFFHICFCHLWCVGKFLEFMKTNNLLINFPGLNFTVKRSQLRKLVAYETRKSSIYEIKGEVSRYSVIFLGFLRE